MLATCNKATPPQILVASIVIILAILHSLSVFETNFGSNKCASGLDHETAILLSRNSTHSLAVHERNNTVIVHVISAPPNVTCNTSTITITKTVVETVENDPEDGTSVDALESSKKSFADWFAPVKSHTLGNTQFHGFTILGTDCHVGPRADTSQVLRRLGMNYVDWSPHVAARVGIQDLFDKNLQYDLLQRAQRAFYETYKNDPEILRADAFICYFDPHWCALFFPFGKPVIMDEAIRLEGHYPTNNENAARWLADVMRMEEHPDMIFSATNFYDAYYIHHFTGSRRILPLPAVGDYVYERMEGEGCVRSYQPELDVITFGPKRLSDGGNIVAQEIMATARRLGSRYEVKTLPEVYSRFRYCDLTRLRAIIILGYSVHSYFAVDAMALAMPMFVPTPRLYAEWEVKYHLISERNSVLQQSNTPLLPDHPRARSYGISPNNDYNETALQFWVKYSDYYYWRGAIFFDTLDELVHKINTVDLQQHYKKMEKHRALNRKYVDTNWEHIFRYLFSNKQPGRTPVPQTFEAGMELFQRLSTKPTFNKIADSPIKKDAVPDHDKWIVITTINSPTDQVKKLANTTSGWKVVVVGDLNTPPDWAWNNCIYLGPDKQKELGYRILEKLPWNFYTRKNVGYLYAIQHGAKTIYDTDDDNVISGDDPFMLPSCMKKASVTSTTYRSVNHHIYFGDKDGWPRGFPLQDIKHPGSRKYTVDEVANVFSPVQQGIVNNDPDVDAIQRLTTRVKGTTFKDASDALVVGIGHMSPFNSQNTIFHYSAFWGLYLPSTTSFRVCDIWRGYWVQRLLWEMGAHLSFLRASAIQERNPHDLLKDLVDELDLYEHSGELIDYLRGWVAREEDSFPQRMDGLMWDLVFKGFIERPDAEMARAWLQDLADVGYIFPTVSKGSGWKGLDFNNHPKVPGTSISIRC